MFDASTDEMVAHVSLENAMMMSVMKVQQQKFNQDYGDSVDVKEFFAEHRSVLHYCKLCTSSEQWLELSLFSVRERLDRKTSLV